MTPQRTKKPSRKAQEAAAAGLAVLEEDPQALESEQVDPEVRSTPSSTIELA